MNLYRVSRERGRRKNGNGSNWTFHSLLFCRINSKVPRGESTWNSDFLPESAGLRRLRSARAALLSPQSAGGDERRLAAAKNQLHWHIRWAKHQWSSNSHYEKSTTYHHDWKWVYQKQAKNPKTKKKQHSPIRVCPQPFLFRSLYLYLQISLLPLPFVCVYRAEGLFIIQRLNNDNKHTIKWRIIDTVKKCTRSFLSILLSPLFYILIRSNFSIGMSLIASIFNVRAG